MKDIEMNQSEKKNKKKTSSVTINITNAIRRAVHAEDLRHLRAAINQNVINLRKYAYETGAPKDDLLELLYRSDRYEAFEEDYGAAWERGQLYGYSLALDVSLEELLAPYGNLWACPNHAFNREDGAKRGDKGSPVAEVNEIAVERRSREMRAHLRRAMAAAGNAAYEAAWEAYRAGAALLEDPSLLGWPPAVVAALDQEFRDADHAISALMRRDAERGNEEFMQCAAEFAAVAKARWDAQQEKNQHEPDVGTASVAAAPPPPWPPVLEPTAGHHLSGANPDDRVAVERRQPHRERGGVVDGRGRAPGLQVDARVGDRAPARRVWLRIRPAGQRDRDWQHDGGPAQRHR